MRRQFLRIPGSPQATPSVETPAHCAPTLFNGVWLFLSEVVIGNVEPTMSLCPAQSEHGCKFTKFLQIIGGNGQKSLKLVLKCLGRDTSCREFLLIME